MGNSSHGWTASVKVGEDDDFKDRYAVYLEKVLENEAAQRRAREIAGRIDEAKPSNNRRRP